MQEAIQLPLVIGHRGASAHHPENTLRAFREAMRGGADGVEMDVRESRDGHFVIHHDEDVGGSAIAALDLAGIRARGPADADARVPTLEEALESLRPHAPRIVLVEVKAARSYRKLHDVLASSFSDLPITAMSFDLDILGELRACDAVMRLALVRAERTADPVAALENPSLQALALQHGAVEGGVAAALHAAEKTLYVWTVNDARVAEEMAREGADGIITDDPAWARSALQMNL